MLNIANVTNAVRVVYGLTYMHLSAPKISDLATKAPNKPTCPVKACKKTQRLTPRSKSLRG